MKKFFFLGLIITVIFINCKSKQEEAKVETEPTIGVSKKDTMDSNKARELIKQINKLKLDKDSLAYTDFDLSVLQAVLCDTASAKTITRVRFFIGAIDTTILGKLRKMPLIIMQVQRSGSDLTPEPSYEYYEGKPYVCPPPEPCLLEEKTL